MGGLALWMPMMATSLAAYNPSYGDADYASRINEKALTATTTFFVSALSMPLALSFQSPYVGTVAVGGAYAYLSMVMAKTMSKLRGTRTRGDDVYWAGIGVSALINTALVALKLRGTDVSTFNVLVKPACAFGCIGMYTTMLIMTADYRRKVPRHSTGGDCGVGRGFWCRDSAASAGHG